MARTESQKSAQKPTQKQRPGFAAGSEGWDGTEDPTRPVASSDERIARDDSSAPRERDSGTQSDYALSDSGDQAADDGRYSVAEELNFDVASDSARRVGEAPQEGNDAMGEALRREAGSAQSDEDKDALKRAIERNVPPGWTE